MNVEKICLKTWNIERFWCQHFRIKNSGHNINLVGRQQWEVIRRVGDDVSLAAGITRGGRIPEPVETDTQHAVGAERGHEQVAVLAGLAELRQRTVVQRDLTHSTPVPRNKYCLVKPDLVQKGGQWSERLCLNYLLAKLSGVEYPPRRPAPSAKINSSSGVAPPVISERISVKAFWLK